MKHKLNILRVGSKTYYHHANGVLVRKNRFRLAALNSLIMLVIAGGFFGSYNYLIPVLRSSSYFQAKDVTVDNIVSAEQASIEYPKASIVKEDELLKFAINQKIASYPKSQNWSVFAHELGSDLAVRINQDKTYDAASLYKLFLLEALENKLPYDKWEYTYTGGKSIKSCVEEMLKVADDPCGEEIGNYVGWDFIDEFNQKSGFGSTSLAGLSGRQTTASDVADLISGLKKGHILSDNARRLIFDVLYQQTYSEGLAKGCGDCRTASKSGELSNISHDAGVITHGGKSYVLVIMSDGGSFEQISEITKLVDERFSN